MLVEWAAARALSNLPKRRMSISIVNRKERWGVDSQIIKRHWTIKTWGGSHSMTRASFSTSRKCARIWMRKILLKSKVYPKGLRILNFRMMIVIMEQSEGTSYAAREAIVASTVTQSKNFNSILFSIRLLCARIAFATKIKELPKCTLFARLHTKKANWEESAAFIARLRQKDRFGMIKDHIQEGASNLIKN